MAELIFGNDKNLLADIKIVVSCLSEPLNYENVDDFLSLKEFNSLESDKIANFGENKVLYLVVEENSHPSWQKLGKKLAQSLFDFENALVIAPLSAVYDIAFGFELGSYSFDKYAIQKKASEFSSMERLIFAGNCNKDGYKPFAAIANAVRYAKDLINEPADLFGKDNLLADIKRLEYLDLKVKPYADFVAVEHWGNLNKKDFDFVLQGKAMEDKGGIYALATIKALALQKSNKNISAMICFGNEMPQIHNSQNIIEITTLNSQVVGVFGNKDNLNTISALANKYGENVVVNIEDSSKIKFNFSNKVFENNEKPLRASGFGLILLNHFIS